MKKTAFKILGLAFSCIITKDLYSISDFAKIQDVLCHGNTVSTAAPRSATSEVQIFGNRFIRKLVKHYLNYDVFKREVEYLAKLRNFDHVPKILYVDYDNNVLYMEYGGERLSKDNLPSNWQQQVRDIINGLRLHGVQHNDIKNAELLVKNGKIMLIDFGWASEYDEPVPSEWPSGLGDSFKAPWGFDDRYSIIRAILIAKNGVVPSSEEVKSTMDQVFSGAASSYVEPNAPTYPTVPKIDVKPGVPHYQPPISPRGNTFHKGTVIDTGSLGGKVPLTDQCEYHGYRYPDGYIARCAGQEFAINVTLAEDCGIKRSKLIYTGNAVVCAS